MQYINNLLAIRLKNNLSQQEFADELGMNVTVYSRYERGERDLPLQTAKMIAYTFDVDMNYLSCFEQDIDYDIIELNGDVLAEEQERENELALERYLEAEKEKELQERINEIEYEQHIKAEKEKEKLLQKAPRK